MPDQDEDVWGAGESPHGRNRSGLIARALAVAARALEAEAERWFLWIPVLFASGILTYFALHNEPDPRVAAVLALAAVGLCLTVRQAPLGLALGGACLAFALGFATAQLRSEMVRAPVLTDELRFARVTGYVEAFELRSGRRARLTLRVISLGDLDAAERPYRVRVSTTAKIGPKAGEAISFRAELSPPPKPVEPGGFDFARQAWFDRLGATGYTTSRIEPLTGVPPLAWDLRRISSSRLSLSARPAGRRVFSSTGAC